MYGVVHKENMFSYFPFSRQDVKSLRFGNIFRNSFAYPSEVVGKCLFVELNFKMILRNT